MNIQQVSLPPGNGGGSGPRIFHIKWKGMINQWQTPGKGRAVPISVVLAAITELVNQEQGRAFFLPSLSKASGFPVTLDRVSRNLTIEKMTEGADAGIFKVTAEVTAETGDKKSFSFCLNSSKSPQSNALHHDICQNLARARKMNPDYPVRPFYLGKGKALHQGQEISLAVLSTEWLEEFTEVNMTNIAERRADFQPDPGFAVVGLRRMILNDPVRFRSLEEAVIQDEQLADSIAAEMVKILALYFNPQTGEGIEDWGVNNGDFVYKPKPDGSVGLKLVTIRKFGCIPLPKYFLAPHFIAFPFIDRLLMHRENSITQQDPADPRHEDFAIHPFTPTDICRGLKLAFVERYGQEKAREILLKWIGTYLLGGKLAAQIQPAFEDKQRMFRTIFFHQEAGRFLFEEEKYPRGMVIEI